MFSSHAFILLRPFSVGESVSVWCVHVYACERASSTSSAYTYEGLCAVLLGSASLCKAGRNCQ